jgi:hypothetical protein
MILGARPRSSPLRSANALDLDSGDLVTGMEDVEDLPTEGASGR